MGQRGWAGGASNNLSPSLQDRGPFLRDLAQHPVLEVPRLPGRKGNDGGKRVLASHVVKGHEVYTLICLLTVLLLSAYYVSDIVLGLEGKAVNKSDTALGVSFIWGMGWGRQIIEGPIRIQCKVRRGKGRWGRKENGAVVRALRMEKEPALQSLGRGNSTCKGPGQGQEGAGAWQ